MILSYSRKFIFIHIHKTGGESITAALRSSLPRSDFVISYDWPTWIQNLRTAKGQDNLASLRKHSPARAIARTLDPEVWEHSFKFAFVRHPIARTISLYRYAAWKLEERRRLLPRNALYLLPPVSWNDPLRWRAIRALVDTGSFSGFIRHPLLERDLSMIAQWHSLTDDAGRNLIDYVGRFENLQHDFHIVQDRIGMTRSQLPWRNATEPSASAQLTVSQEDRAYLVDRFQADFAAFTYDTRQDF